MVYFLSYLSYLSLKQHSKVNLYRCNMIFILNILVSSCSRWLVSYDLSFYLNQLFYNHHLFFSSFTLGERIKKLASHLFLRINPFSSLYSGLIARKQRNILTLTFYSLFLCQSKFWRCYRKGNNTILFIY